VSIERELLKRVLEMIKIVPMMASIGNVPTDFASELIIEIQQLLSQPEQEPVAWMQDDIELYVLEEKDIVRGWEETIKQFGEL